MICDLTVELWCSLNHMWLRWYLPSALAVAQLSFAHHLCLFEESVMPTSASCTAVVCTMRTWLLLSELVNANETLMNRKFWVWNSKSPASKRHSLPNEVYAVVTQGTVYGMSVLTYDNVHTDGAKGRGTRMWTLD